MIGIFKGDEPCFPRIIGLQEILDGHLDGHLDGCRAIVGKKHFGQQ